MKSGGTLPGDLSGTAALTHPDRGAQPLGLATLSSWDTALVCYPTKRCRSRSRDGSTSGVSEAPGPDYLSPPRPALAAATERVRLPCKEALPDSS